MAPRSGRRYLALRTGVTAAAAVTSNTFARGLLPRTTTDQAMATGVTAAIGLGVGTLAVSAVEATAELVATSRGRGDPENTTLIAAAILAGAGLAAARLLPNTSTTPLPVATGNSVARSLGGGAAAAALVITSDKATRQLVGPVSPAIGMVTAAAIGGTISAIRVNARDRRALAVGETGDRHQIQRPKTAVGMAKSAALGGSVGAGLMVLAGTEYALAEGSTALVSRALGRSDNKVTPLVGHSIAAALMVPAGIAALDRLRRRIQHADDVVEAAYPDAPTSRSVTAGPASLIAFNDIGKEGRRFVLMTLGAHEIADVMGEPAVDPIRAVAGFESARTPETRADLALSELDALGAYEKSVIVVAAPTGVGYVNYSFAEALEYLTRGDCAIVVPQYALVPSALALNQTDAGVRMQTLILQGIRDRIAALPEGSRPRLLQFGESLGAQVALDVAADGTAVFDDLGLERGLYLGTPFRTELWDRWFADPAAADPSGILGKVARADEIPSLPGVGPPCSGHPSRRPDQHVLLRRRRADALVDGSAADPATAGPAGDVVPADHDVRHHAGRPQERDELQARRLRSPGPRLPDRAVRRDPPHLPTPRQPGAGRPDRAGPAPAGAGLGHQEDGRQQVRLSAGVRAGSAAEVGRRPEDR